MKTITLATDGSILSNGSGSKEKDPIRHLGNQVALMAGYRLRSFFRMLENYPELSRMNEFFPEAIRQYRTLAEEMPVYPDVEHLELGKTIEMIGFPGKPRLEIYSCIRGVHNDKPMEIRNIDLSFLIDLPLRLGRLRHIIFGDSVDVFEFETVYTLFEFIDGIAWELGFHTIPEACELRR